MKTLKIESRRKHSSFGRYFLCFTAPVVVFFLLLILAAIFLVKSGETVTGVEAVEIQMKNPVNFSQALFYRPHAYKIEMTKKVRPRVLILGSSRAMQFVPDPWKVPTYNAGGALDSVQALQDFTEKALRNYKPETLILSVDWWWFNQRYLAELQPLKNRLSLHELAYTYQWWQRNRISLPQFLRTIVGPSYDGGIGVGARFFFAGWTSFGNYKYGLMLTPLSEKNDVKFEDTLKAIARNRHQKKDDVTVNAPFDQGRWDIFAGVIKNLTSSGIHVVLIIPPVAPPLADYIARQPQPTLVAMLQAHLRTLDVPVFDFHDPRPIGLPVCEFIDGIHAGAMINLRMLRTIAASDPVRFLAYVDVNVIDSLLRRYSGRASIPDKTSGVPDESDFLEIGCDKNSGLQQ